MVEVSNPAYILSPCNQLFFQILINTQQHSFISWARTVPNDWSDVTLPMFDLPISYSMESSIHVEDILRHSAPPVNRLCLQFCSPVSGSWHAQGYRGRNPAYCKLWSVVYDYTYSLLDWSMGQLSQMGSKSQLNTRPTFRHVKSRCMPTLGWPVFYFYYIYILLLLARPFQWAVKNLSHCCCLRVTYMTDQWRTEDFIPRRMTVNQMGLYNNPIVLWSP